MAVFKVSTKNKIDIDKKPRVFFTCHPDDFEKYFKKICDDIFETHDCAIYFTEDMTEMIADDEKTVDLGRNNLFIIPVTLKLLTTPNRAMDEDIPYALKEHIPVLPIMMEPGINEFYSKPDKFGELQYLNPYSADLTEISYKEKMKKYLESVLISDELARRVRAAFDAYIFLSYRKKDRKYANELMRLIHSNPECRDIAIWFDEFLTPGENFKENIEKVLNDCKLFTLLVSPHLLEKVVDENGEERDNYVISTELPLARKKKQENGTDIFAVEMEKTDREALSAISIEDYTNPQNADFRKRLLETISHIAITTNNTPEHNFLIGLAYLDGIDVEVDRQRAIELITDAGEKNLPEAMEKLFHIYRSIYDYRQAAFWAGRILNHRKTQLGEDHPDTLSAMHNLAYTLGDLGRHDESLSLQQEVMDKRLRALGEDHPDTLSAMHNLAYTLGELGRHNEALKLKQDALEKNRCNLGEDHPDTLLAMCNLSVSLSALGRHDDTLTLQQEIMEKSRCNLGEDHPDTLLAMHNLAYTLGELGRHDEALSLQQEVADKYRRILGEHHPETLAAISNLSSTLGALGRHDEALKLKQDALEKSFRSLGEDHPATWLAMHNLAYTLGDLSRHDEALSLQQEVMDKCLRALGENHPDTLAAMYNLAYTLSALGRHDEVLSLQQEAAKINLRNLGEEHPDTLRAMHHLACTLFLLRRHDEARTILQAVLNKSRRVLGDYHPRTLDTMESLIAVLLETRKYFKAWALLSKLHKLQKEAIRHK